MSRSRTGRSYSFIQKILEVLGFPSPGINSESHHAYSIGLAFYLSTFQTATYTAGKHPVAQVRTARQGVLAPRNSLPECSLREHEPVMRRSELRHQILALLNSDRTVLLCQAVDRGGLNFTDFTWEIHISDRCSCNHVAAQNLLHPCQDFKVAGTDHHITFRTGSATAHGARHTLQDTSFGLGPCVQSCCMAIPLNSILGLHRTPGPLRGTTCHQEPDRGVSG